MKGCRYQHIYIPLLLPPLPKPLDSSITLQRPNLRIIGLNYITRVYLYPPLNLIWIMFWTCPFYSIQGCVLLILSTTYIPTSYLI